MTKVMRYAQPLVLAWGFFYRIFPQPSHHIPYMYSMAGAAFKSQERVREIALANYNNTPTGLSGVGPVPAYQTHLTINISLLERGLWPDECLVYILSHGILPGEPCLRGIYRRIVSFASRLLPSSKPNLALPLPRPFFEKISIALESSSSLAGDNSNRNLTITALGARTKPYIKSLTIDGVPVDSPVIYHAQISHGAEIVFEMSAEIEAWGNDPALVAAFGPSAVLTGAGNGDASSPQVSIPLPRGTRDKNSDDTIRDEL